MMWNSQLKVGYYKDNALTVNGYNCKSDRQVVYAIEINGDIYIGSTSALKKRLNIHISYLKNNKHTSKCMQEEFNKCMYFNVYVLMVLGSNSASAQMAEQGFILLLSPRFNKGKPKGYANPFIERTWEMQSE